VESLTGVFMATVELAAGARVRFDGLGGRSVFLYVVRGTVRIAGASAPAFHLVELVREGDAVEIEAAEDAILLFGHADPIREPIIAHGPFVMNTREEIVQAIHDYQAGKFGPLP
jgi:redox-sensitive bicupin YhaK (pirin superfamily)